jgi:Tol biopolymer transport system component
VLDGHWEGVSWSPDGRRLVAYGFPQLEGGRFDVYTMDPDGTDLVRLTDDETVERQPSWSPDGTKIVFATGDGFDLDIYVMAADGSDVRRLTGREGIDLFPVWSPDGEWIAFASDRDLSPEVRAANRSGETRFRTAIYVMRVDGSDVVAIPRARGGITLPVSWTA